MMNLQKTLTLATVVILGLTACSDEQSSEVAALDAVDVEKTAPDVTFKPQEGYTGTTVKPGAPYSISYRIIGTPLVGSPVTIDLRIDSAMGPRPMTLDYRINDGSSMLLAESQPASVRMEPAANENNFSQQVTVIPQRDGRLYLNVSASYETENGTQSTVAAIPIQIGSGPRQLEENGALQVDENGETVRVLESSGE